VELEAVDLDDHAPPHQEVDVADARDVVLRNGVHPGDPEEDPGVVWNRGGSG
jgi:hypothetical protein